MKLTTLILVTACGAAASFPVAAHHNCNSGETCPEEIGDYQTNHEGAIEALDMEGIGGQMDPNAI